MAKSENQKLKILYLRDYLRRNTDENHPATVNDIIAHLASRGIEVERKTVYADIDLLTNVYGEDIIFSRARPAGYYVASLEFETPELKLLVDSVQSSKFVTPKKTISLIKKIEGLTNIYEEKNLNRQVIIHNSKVMDESVYRIVDKISTAINDDKIIHFKYRNYNLKKELVYRHDGRIYEVSPFAFIWNDENYYLLGYDTALEEIRHFRVDKMSYVEVTTKKRVGKDEFSKINMAAYNSSVFGMFRGDPVRVTLRFAEDLVGVVIDRFGKNVIIFDEGNGTFTATVDVHTSSQFYAWVFGFGKKCEILEPQSARDEMKKRAAEIAESY